MHDHAIGSTADEMKWSEATDRAVLDGAVATYFTLERLLSQLPVTMRDAVRQEMQSFGPPPPAAWFCYGYVRLDEAVGTWRVWQRRDRPDVQWFLVAVSQTDYDAAIAQIENILAKQREMSVTN